MLLREFTEGAEVKREGEELMATKAGRVLSVNVGAVRSSNTTVVLPRVASGNHLSPVGSTLEASTSTETTRRIEKRMGDPIR